MALRLRGATSGYIELKAPASAGDNTLTLPTNNGSANQLLKTDGSGNLSWVDDNSGVSLSGSTNNTIATVTGANALQGEANLTFDGSTLTVTGAVGISTDLFHIGDDDTKIAFTDNQIDLRTGNLSRIYLNNYALYVKSGFPFAFLASSGDSPNIKSGGTNAQDLLLTTGSGNPTRLQVGVGGDVTVNTGNLVIGTAGKGIDFSAQTASSATGATTTSEVLDHYEEGTWTPSYGGADSNPTCSYENQVGQYVRTGRIVTLHLRLRTDSVSGGSGTLKVRGLPFQASSYHGMYGGFITYTGAWKADSAPTLFHIGSSNNEGTLYKREDGNEDPSAMQVSDLNTTNDDNDLRLTAIYYCQA